MKKLTGFATMLMAAVLLIAVSCKGSGKKSLKEQGTEVARIEVSISGMTCAGCEQTIQTNVAKMEGVKSVKAICTVGKAYIDYNPALVDSAGIRKIITDAGYTVTGFSPMPVTDSVK
jgi:copper chaperone CopZ